MKILLDHCVPRRLRQYLSGHEIRTAFEMGWEAYKNGFLLTAAEASGFEAFVTVDQNLPHQQSIGDRKIALLVLVAQSNTLESLRPLVSQLQDRLGSARPGEIILLEMHEADAPE